MKNSCKKMSNFFNILISNSYFFVEALSPICEDDKLLWSSNRAADQRMLEKDGLENLQVEPRSPVLVREQQRTNLNETYNSQQRESQQKVSQNISSNVMGSPSSSYSLKTATNQKVPVEPENKNYEGTLEKVGIVTPIHSNNLSRQQSSQSGVQVQSPDSLKQQEKNLKKTEHAQDNKQVLGRMIQSQRGVKAVAEKQERKRKTVVEKGLKRMTIFRGADLEQQAAIEREKQNQVLLNQKYFLQLETSIFDNPSISHDDRKKYMAMMESLEKQVVATSPQHKANLKKMIRRKFAGLLNKVHLPQEQITQLGISSLQHDIIGKDRQDLIEMPQLSDQEMFMIDPFSVLNSPSQARHQGAERHPQADQFLGVIRRNQESLDCSPLLDSEQGYISQQQRIREIMESYLQEMNGSLQQLDELYDEESDHIEEDDDSQFSVRQDRQKATRCQLTRTHRDPHLDFYPLVLVNEPGFHTLKLEFKTYSDDFPLLTVRKSIVFMVRGFHILSERIVNHKMFAIGVLICIIINMKVFSDEKLNINSKESQEQLTQFKTVLLYLFLSENILKLSGKGIIGYFQDLWDIFDLFLLALFGLHFVVPSYIPLDISPFRLLRILPFLGLFIKPLQIMLISLSNALKFLIESLIIELIFTVYLTLLILHLFAGLYSNVCFDLEVGIPGDKLYCGFESCPGNQYCGPFGSGPSIPSSYDNFGYAYLQVMKGVLQTDWTHPMYVSMRAYHPATFIIFIMVIFLPSIFGGNLMIAVVKTNYRQTMEKYEDAEIEALQDEKFVYKTELNLRVLKEYQLYQQINETVRQFIKNKQAQKKLKHLNRQQPIEVKRVYPIDSQLQSPSDPYGKLEQNVDVQKRKSNQNVSQELDGGIIKKKKKARKFLSARDNRKFEEDKNKKLGIENLNKKKTTFEQITELLSIRRLLLPKKSLKNLINAQIAENQKLNSDERCVSILYKLKHLNFLAWKVSLKSKDQLSYVSTSESEIFSVLEQQKKLKRKHQIEFNQIRTSRQMHLYLYTNKEINKHRLQFKKNSYSQSGQLKLKSGCPILRQSGFVNHEVKSEIKQLKQTQINLMESNFLKENNNSHLEPTRKQKLPNESVVQQLLGRQFSQGQMQIHSKVNKLTINNLEYDLEEIKKIIDKPILLEQEENPVETNEHEELYLQYRKFEAQSMYSVKHTYSDEVLHPQPSFQKKIMIYRSLNKYDLAIWLVGFSGFLAIIKKHIIWVMRQQAVEIFFDMCILFNFLLFALYGFIHQDSIIYLTNIVTILLGLELLMRLISQDLRIFLMKFRNIFEGSIILACFGEILITYALNSQAQRYQIALQLIRVLKIILFYRVMKYNAFAVEMALILEKTYNQFFQLIFLLFFLLLIYAYYGIDLFTRKFPQDDILGQVHSYEDIYQAWNTVFNISTNDDWYGVVVLGCTYSNIVFTILYCCSLGYIVNLMTFGLLIAVVLDAFSKYLGTPEEVKGCNENDLYVQELDLEENIKQDINQKMINQVTLYGNSSDLFKEQTDQQEQNIVFNTLQDGKQDGKGENGVKNVSQKIKVKFLDMEDCIKQIVDKEFKAFVYYSEEECEDSLFILRKDNKIRRMLYRVIKTPVYSFFINFVLIISLILMGLITYLDYESYEYPILNLNIVNTLDDLITIIIFMDSIIKIIAFGFCYEKGTFLSEIWRTIDFVYVTCQILIWITQSQNSLLNLLLFLKFLRPMRLNNLFQGLKEVKDALAASLPAITNVFFVQFLFFMVFGIFGVILYNGRMGYCEDPMNFGVGRNQCANEGREWIVPVFNFENIIEALQILFIICTLDSWGVFFQICFNSGPEETGPQALANQWVTYFFYFIFVLIGSYFFLGFITGILYTYFTENRKKLINSELSIDQMLFAEISETIIKEKPQYSDPPSDPIRLMAARIIQNPYYRAIISPLLFLNTSNITLFILQVVLCLFYFRSPYQQFQILNVIHHSFATVLICDTVLKLLTYGLVRYFAFIWRKFEFMLSVFSLADLIIDLTFQWTEYYYKYNVSDPYFLWIRLAFALRDFRVLLIIQEFKGLLILLTLYRTLKTFKGNELLNALLIEDTLSLLTVLTSVCICRMQALWTSKFGSLILFMTYNKGVVIDDYLNFQNVSQALLTLFKCSTNDSWIYIMTDSCSLNPFCSNDPTQCGQSKLVVYIYYFSYEFISNFIAFQLFVLALVEQFECNIISIIKYFLEFFNSQNNVIQTFIENIDHFKIVWCKYSQETKGECMHTKFLAHFLLEVGEPLGSSKGDNIWDAARSASNFHIKADHNGYVHFTEVLYETVKYVFKQQTFQTGSEEGIRLIKQNDKQIRYRLNHRRLKGPNRRTPVTKQVILKGNFNILQEYIYVLSVYRVWTSYTNKFLTKARQARKEGNKFEESINVSYNDKNDSVSEEDDTSLKFEDFEKYEMQQRQLTEQDEQDEDEDFDIDRYIQKKNPSKKSNYKSSFFDRLATQNNETNIIFEPLYSNNQSNTLGQNQHSLQTISEMEPEATKYNPKTFTNKTKLMPIIKEKEKNKENLINLNAQQQIPMSSNFEASNNLANPFGVIVENHLEESRNSNLSQHADKNQHKDAEEQKEGNIRYENQIPRQQLINIITQSQLTPKNDKNDVMYPDFTKFYELSDGDDVLPNLNQPDLFEQMGDSPHYQDYDVFHDGEQLYENQSNPQNDCGEIEIDYKYYQNTLQVVQDPEIVANGGQFSQREAQGANDVYENTLENQPNPIPSHNSHNSHIVQTVEANDPDQYLPPTNRSGQIIVDNDASNNQNYSNPQNDGGGNEKNPIQILDDVGNTEIPLQNNQQLVDQEEDLILTNNQCFFFQQSPIRNDDAEDNDDNLFTTKLDRQFQEEAQDQKQPVINTKQQISLRTIQRKVLDNQSGIDQKFRAYRKHKSL